MADSSSSDELDLRAYLRVLNRRKLVILATVVGFVGVALVMSFLETPTYEAGAEVLLKTSVAESSLNQNPFTAEPRDPDRSVRTEVAVIQSDAIEKRVEHSLGEDAPPVHVSAQLKLDVVTLNVTDADAKKAAKYANAYAKEYIDFKRDKAVESSDATVLKYQQQVDQLQAQIDALSPTPDAALLNQVRIQALTTQQSALKSAQQQLQVLAGVTTGGAQLVSPAETPGDPVSPKPLRNGILFGFVGLIFGIGFAFLRDYFDDSIRERDDVERATGGLPLLAMIPTLTEWKKRDEPRVVALDESHQAVTESYRALRTSVQFRDLDHDLRIVQVTSASAAEGKTTTLANLGVLFARAGERVVIVDCDLRRPRIHQFFGLSNEIGFTSVLLGEAPLSQAVQEVPGVERLAVLSSGRIPPLPSELLASERTADILRLLASEYDKVLVDSPPVVAVTDASVLAKWVDGILLIAASNKTSRRHLHRAYEVLRQVDAPLLGTVLNLAPSGAAYAYGYGYVHYDKPAAAGATNGNGFAASSMLPGRSSRA